MRAFFVTAMLVLLLAGTAAADFVFEDIDATGNEPDVALNTLEQPAVCYYEPEAAVLKVAERVGATWHTYVVDATGDMGSDCSIYVDTGDDPHVSYKDNDEWDLRYAYRDGGTWYAATLESHGPIGIGTSMAPDENDLPRISYQDNEGEDLVYMWFEPEDYDTFYVDTTSKVGGEATSIAVRSSTLSYIAYFDDGDEVLRFAAGHGDTWQTTVADDGGGAEVGWDLAMAADAAGQAHIAYYDATNGRLKYAVGDLDGFASEVADGRGWCGTPLDIALDAAGRPHVCYVDTDGMVRYGYRSAGEWSLYDLVEGAECSIAVNGEDVVTIVYTNVDGALRAAIGDAEGLEPQPPDDDDDVTDDDTADDDAADDDNADDDAADDDDGGFGDTETEGEADDADEGCGC